MYTYIASYSRQAVHRSGDAAVFFSGERRNYNVPELYKNRFSLFFKDVDHVTYLPTYLPVTHTLRLQADRAYDHFTQRKRKRSKLCGPLELAFIYNDCYYRFEKLIDIQMGILTEVRKRLCAS